jgi:hypothetical protein
VYACVCVLEGARELEMLCSDLLTIFYVNNIFLCQ